MRKARSALGGAPPQAQGLPPSCHGPGFGETEAGKRKRRKTSLSHATFVSASSPTSIRSWDAVRCAYLR